VPRVSIIVIFLNAERFLAEAIESVLSQTYSDWELLLVDDGSTDAGTVVARRYAEHQSGRVRYLHHEGHRNLGMSASRNLGIRSARGEYVAFLDADDVWFPNKLAEQCAILDAHPEAVMVFGDPLYWHSWTNAAADRNADQLRGIWTPANAVVRPPEMLKLSYPLGKGGSPCPSDLMLRRDFVARIGGFEEEFTGSYQLFEDIAFLTKVYLHGRVVASDACWTRYRIHPESCVATVMRDGHYHQVRRFYLKWLKRYLRSEGVRDSEIHKALNRALGKYDPKLLRWLRRQARRATGLVRASTSPA